MSITETDGELLATSVIEEDTRDTVSVIPEESVPKELITDKDKPSYAYLQRDEFTSESFKIEVKGLPKFYGFKEIKKLLTNKLQLNPHKIKPPLVGKGSGYMFVTFRNEEERQKALTTLDGYKWKNKVLSAFLAKPVEDPLIRKRAHEESQGNGDVGIQGRRPHKQTRGNDEQDNESVEDVIKRVTIPWADVPYEEQLSRKMSSTREIVADFSKRIQEVNPGVTAASPQIDDILASPVTEEYRNKCEFTIGYNRSTLEKTVGFRVSSYKDGSVAVGPIEHLTHLPKIMIQAALKVQDFIRSSPLNPFDPESHVGCWRTLTVRTTTDGQVMIMILISSKNMNAEDLDSMKSSLVSHFSSSSDPKINSFYLKVMENHGQTERNIPQLLFGEETITETLLGLKFKISPEAFFQINVKATEVLYSTIGSLIASSSSDQTKTTVLDVCCGTGTIGICVADKAGQVLGLEMIPSAVQDANQNARVNNLDPASCCFYAGKAEDILDILIGKASFPDIVAIVDPPRSGLHQRVLGLLRKCEAIKKIIYVSCDARKASKNFVDLARPTSKTYKGDPFLPSRVIPVDLFPHSHHCELVLLLER